MKQYVVTIYVKSDLPSDEAYARLNDWLGFLTMPKDTQYIDGDGDEVYEPLK